jgi:hypothetical protein
MLKLIFLLYTCLSFAPKHLVRVTAGGYMYGVSNWLDDRVELAIRGRNDSYDVWSMNMNRIRSDRMRGDYIKNR